MKKINLILLVFIFIGLSVIFIYQYYLNQKNYYPIADNKINKIFDSQKECEEKNKCQCSFQSCDFIPEKGTPEDCKNETGWVCIN